MVSFDRDGFGESVAAIERVLACSNAGKILLSHRHFQLPTFIKQSAPIHLSIGPTFVTKVCRPFIIDERNKKRMSPVFSDKFVKDASPPVARD